MIKIIVFILAIIGGLFIGLLIGISYMADNIAYISKKAFSEGYDLGKAETKKRYKIQEGDGE